MAPFLGGAPVLAAMLLACSQRTLKVCLSPGCVADGAATTLDRMRALAPPGCVVEPGGCVSACGAGPVVLEPGEKSQRIAHKRVKNNVLLELLAGADGKGSVPADLVRGYDIVQEAEKASSKGRFADAVVLFEEGISLALGPALARLSSEDGEGSALSPSLEWLVRAQRGEAKARMGTFDKDGAMCAAIAAVELSRRADPLCFEVLAEVCGAKKDSAGELEALRCMFALPEEPDMPRDVAIRRREWGFRFAKLEREASKS